MISLKNKRNSLSDTIAAGKQCKVHNSQISSELLLFSFDVTFLFLHCKDSFLSHVDGLNSRVV